MPSELLKLVKCTGTVLETDDIAIPAGFVAISVDNAPASAKVFHDEVAKNLFDNEWDKSGICNRSQLNGSKSNPIVFSSFPLTINAEHIVLQLPRG